MSRIFPSIWRSITDLYGELFSFVGMNLLWLVVSIPVFLVVLAVSAIVATAALGPETGASLMQDPLFFLTIVLYLMVGPNPASAGLHLYANRLVKEERVEFSLFWEGLRTYALPATALLALSFSVYIVLGFQMAFYATRGELFLQIITAIWFNVALIWTAMQGYLLPLLIEQADKRLTLIVRNAFFITMANIVPTVAILIFIALAFALSVVVVVLLALVTVGLIVVLWNRTLIGFLEDFRARQKPS